MPPTGEDSRIEVDTDALADLLEQHPVRVAVLFGSRATDTAGRHSDVDIAVESEERLSDDERLQSRVELLVEFIETLGTDDVEVVDLDSIRPGVGLSALDSGCLLVGDPSRVETLRDRFEREATKRSHEERMQQSDTILDRMKEHV